VQVELVVQDNQVTAKINTENAAVKEVILTNLDQLKSNLTNAGTQINKFDVEVGGFKNHFERQFSKEGSTNGRHQGGTGHGPPQDSNELMPDQVKNQQALTFYLGRSINCLI
jgi:flagellar hook-length control protein FliK